MVQPPFRLIQFLLFSAFVISALLFMVVITIPEKIGTEEESRFVCGGVIDPDGNRIGQVESMDSLELQKFIQGEQLFKDAGCTSCHDVMFKKVGPPLAKISQRRKHKWIRQAIIDYDVLITRKDKQAIKLREEYGGMSKPQHLFLTMEQVDNIIFYLDHHKK